MPLFGISKDGEFPCIIYHYMREGSLATVLQRKAVNVCLAIGMHFALFIAIVVRSCHLINALAL